MQSAITDDSKERIAVFHKVGAIGQDFLESAMGDGVTAPPDGIVPEWR